MNASAIRALMNEADYYPNAQGSVGFGINRDRLIAILSECTPHLESISVIPRHVGHGVTFFKITTYVTFDRSEMETPDADVG